MLLMSTVSLILTSSRSWTNTRYPIEVSVSRCMITLVTAMWDAQITDLNNQSSRAVIRDNARLPRLHRQHLHEVSQRVNHIADRE
jgi:hypothetical protein